MKNTLLITLLFFVNFSFAQSKSISVIVNGIKNSKGSVLIYLYKNAEGFPTEPAKAWKSTRVNITNNATTFTFDGIPYGNYALSVVHDENANGELDTNFVGIPKEGTGVSNHAKGSFGPPKFTDARFEHKQPLTSQEIKITY